MFFFFKQKTAYEMRISDWSSDVCSSDLESVAQYCVETYYPVTASIKTKFNRLREAYEQLSRRQWGAFIDGGGVIDCFGPNPQPIRIGCEDNRLLVYTVRNQIGRASCRERVCQYV